MKTQTAALWLIASVCSAVKLEDANAFRESQDVEDLDGGVGADDEQPLIPPQQNEEEEASPAEEVEDMTPIDTRVKTTLARVKGFFTRSAVRRKAELSVNLSLFAFTPQAQQLLRCIKLAPQEEVRRRVQQFCNQFKREEAQLTAMCLETAEEAQTRMQSAADSCPESPTGDCIVRKLRLPLTHFMITRKVQGQATPAINPLPLPVITPDAMHFNRRWLTVLDISRVLDASFPTSSVIVKTVQEEIKRLFRKATPITNEEKNDRLFWKAWLLLFKTMQLRPHVDPLLVRLLLQNLSFDSCTDRRVKILESNTRINEKHLRTQTIGIFFAEALAFRECVGWTMTDNCRTLKEYANMSKTLTTYFLPLNETTGPITRDTQLYDEGKMEFASEEERTALERFLEEETQADVTFILEGADKVSTRVVNFIAKSGIGRALVTSVVARILRDAGRLRHEQGEEDQRPDPAQNKLLRSQALLEATAQVESLVRQMSTYVMSGKKPLGLVHKDVLFKILRRELQAITKTEKPRRSLGQRFRRFFKFGRGQSSLQVDHTDDTSALMPVQAHRERLKDASRWTPRPMEASFVQNDKDRGFKRRNVYLMAGGTFIFIGLAVLSSVATGALGIGLIVAGIVALLIPLVGKVVDVVAGTIRRSRSGQSNLLALPAPPPREPGESHPEEDQSPQEAEVSTESGPGRKRALPKHLDIEEVD
ncbi:hypothetical protein ACSSS7_003582 [Eimeria intestinalis]